MTMQECTKCLRIKDKKLFPKDGICDVCHKKEKAVAALKVSKTNGKTKTKGTK